MSKKVKLVIDGKEIEIDLNNSSDCKKYNIHCEDIDDEDDDDDDFDCGTKFGKIRKRIVAVTPVVSVLAFLCLGFFLDAWHPGWLVFLAIPIVPMILSIFNKKGKAFIVGVTSLISVVAFIYIGIFLDAWHPGWLVFFLVPIVSILIGEN